MRRDFPDDCLLHQLFAQQAAATPGAVALICGDLSLTYAELNARANRLAHHLRALGVGPEGLVGLSMERSPEMVIGLLGTLKAGGAYLPLDPDYPAERLTMMLEDARPAVVLTQEHLEARLSSCESRVLCLDRDWGSVVGHDENSSVAGLGPQNLAYVIYTSGSTGLPKGAMNTHQGICNRLLWMQDTYDLTAHDCVVQKTPFSFDVSVWEFFWPLIAGARLVLARPGGHRDASYLAGLIKDAGVTVIHFVPSMLQSFLDEPGLERSCQTLRHLFASGEALAESVASRCLKRLSCRLHNLYGPTEAAVDVTYWECRADDPPGPVPIGKPIANMSVYILDVDRQPLPVGCTGELYLAGIGVARGYLNRPELTAERFLSDPFDDRPDARLYRTGDLGRWRHDGNIEFLGRVDSQVKLRGFRIELGEIETTLSRHPAILQAVAMVREDRPGDHRLVAYLREGADGGPSDKELREFLALSLPDYMVPSAFARLTSFPINSSGKLDRKALPAPCLERSDADVGYVAPRDPVEALLAAIWQDVLGTPRVGVHDNFFHMGGHSLLAAKATARAADQLGHEIPASTLFGNPTVARLAEQLARMRCVENGGRPAPSTPITRRPDGPVHLSFAQQRLWFLEQLSEGLVEYNMSTVCRVHGKLNVEALRRAIEAIIARHEPLRTTFEAHGGWPTQRIHAPTRFDLAIDDLRHFDPQLREAISAERARQAADRPFDLRHDLPLRAMVLRLEDDEYLLLVTMHHIASDGWSMTLFWHELAYLYDGFVRGKQVTLPELRIQYADFAAWQRTKLQGERLARLVDYWRDRLDGLTPLDLPADRPRRRLSERGATHTFAVPGKTIDGLRALGRQAGATLNMVLLGAFQLLLMRYCGQEDVAVGMPTAGRDRSELEDLIGFFVNTLVVRVDLSGNPSFRELLARVKTSSLGAYDHQDLPFDRLVERLRPERELGRNPLVQVIFQMLDVAPAVPTLAELTVSAQPTGGQHVRFDLELLLSPRAEGLHGAVAYRTDLFDEPTIERLFGYYRSLLEGIIIDPDRSVHDLALLMGAERQRLVIDWNDTVADYPRDMCIHQLFEQQAARSPDAVAVVGIGQSLTYGQLNARANQLARQLRAMGVTAEARVGLRLSRSPEMIVAILGILKAGGAYVPLDPKDPEERHRLIAGDAGITVLVTERALASREPSPGARVLFIDDESRDIDVHNDRDLPPESSATNLAYILYTSGSAGEPKGVLIENRSVVRLVHADYATFGPDRVFLQLAPLAFDASTFEIWGALLHGARLVLAPDGPPDLVVLERLIQTARVTTAWLTAGLFNEIVESRPRTLAGLREILTGGDALSVKHVRIAYQALPQPLRIINGYGPTESTTFACCQAIDPSELEHLDNIPIGRPIANTRAYALDGRGQPVPIGVAGELYLGGDGLARGYLNRPEATAERFVVGNGIDERLYRTGDRVRWRGDGTLEFLGRVDNQVKLRGFRIELGAIETALSRHPAIRQAAVLLREDRPGDRRLVAYLLTDGDAIDDRDVTAYLARTLPDYMMPSKFVHLSSFPLNANGKVDRKALPAPRCERLDGEAGYVPPHDAVEERLASIWQEVLSTPRVGVNDDFFQLGGHSLLAIRLLAKIDNDLGVKLPISAVFRAGTIARMAMAVKSRAEAKSTAADPRGEEYDPVVTLQPLGDRPPLFMLPGRDAHVISLRDLAILIGSEHAVYGLQPTGHSLRVLSYPSIEELAGALIKCMRQIASRGPYNLVGFSAGGLIAYEIAQQLTRSGEQVGLLGLLDTYGPGFGTVLPVDERLGRHLRLFRRLGPMEYARDRRRAIRRRVRRVFGSSRRRTEETKAQPLATGSSGTYAWREVNDRYRYTPYAGDVDLFTADTPNWLGTDSDPTMGWGTLVQGELGLHQIPGDHRDIIRAPSANVLAMEIRKCLDRKRHGLPDLCSKHDFIRA